MQKNDTKQPCTDECRPLVIERNRYFTGKYMTARDFGAEQDYFLGHHRLHNRLLHGWGVACGYGVTKHPNPDCPEWVVVGPGIALDCCGRELVLREHTPLRVALPHLDQDQDEEPEEPGHDGPGAGAPSQNGGDGDHDGDHDGDGDGDGEPPAERRLLLCAVYGEQQIEHVPVIYDEDGCDPRRREANRVRETVRLELHPFADFDPACWGLPGGGATRCRDDCDKELPAGGGGCLEPECECGSCVPLALITVGADGAVHIDTQGRRRLPPPPEYLTHVAQTNWVYGATMTQRQLVEQGRLEIRFDREIAPAEGIATGVNAETFLVQHAGEGEDLEFVPYDVHRPPYLQDGCRAVYVIDPNFLNGRRRGGLTGSTIYITLLADFVLDCHQLPVDGDHLAGRLPSGNGTPGGTFRSWFRIGDDQTPEEAS